MELIPANGWKNLHQVALPPAPDLGAWIKLYEFDKLRSTAFDSNPYAGVKDIASLLPQCC